MGLKDLYYALEDKYYKFLDWLDGKGIPVYKLADPIDKIVPSFIIVLIIATLLLSGIIYAVAFSLGVFPGVHDIVVTFKDKAGENVPNLDLSILVGENTLSDKTNMAGAVLFEAMPGETVKFTGSFKGQEFSKELAVTKELSYVVDLPFNTAFQTVNFTLAPADGYLAGPVNISFTCSNSTVVAPDDYYSYTESIVNVEVDPGCGNLLVSVTGGNYQDVISRNTLSGDIIPLDSLMKAGNCALVVNVVDAGNNPIDGSDLTFYFGDYDTFYMNATGVANGMYRLTDLPVDKYKVLATKSGYISDPQNVTFTRDGETQTVTLQMRVSGEGAGYVAAKVFDKTTTSPIVGAKLCVWEMNAEGQQGTQVGCAESDTNGLVRVPIPDATKKFWLNVTRTLYKGFTQKDVSANSVPVQAYLERIREEDKCLKVKVADVEDKAVSNAKVYLYDKESNLLAFDAAITDDNGITLPCIRGVNDGFYKVYAYKASYNVMSETFEYRTDMQQDQYHVKVVLGLPTSTLKIVIKDSFGKPVPNAIVKLYDAYGTLAFEGAMHSNALGEFLKTGLRADKKLYYVIEADTYERYVSLAKFLVPDVENTDEVVLDKLSLDRKQKISVLGVYTEDNLVVNKVVPGELYKLRLKVLLPDDNDDYKKAHVTVVAGIEDVVEKEFFSIEKIERSGLASITKGRYYNADDEDATRKSNNTRNTLNESKEGLAFEDAAKWVQMSWNLDKMQVYNGVMFEEVYFRVKENMPENTKLTFMYDLATKKGSEELYYPGAGYDAGSQAAEDALGNVTNNKSEYFVFSGKGQQICDEQFCIEATMYDVSEDLIADMLGDVPYVANVGKVYDFTFSLMNANKKPLTNYRVILDNPQETIRFKTSKIKSVMNIDDNADLADQGGELENNYKIVHRSTETLEKNNVIRGLISLEPNKLGNASLRFTIIEDNREVYKKEFYVNVVATKDMNVNVEPSVLAAYTYLKLNFTVTDTITGEGIENAKVYIKDAVDTLLVAGERTGREGKLELVLPSQKPNMKLFVTVFKEEYKPYEVVYKTSADFLTLNPNELKISIKVPEEWGETKITIKNTSDLAVVIKSIGLEGDFDEFIDTKEVNTALESAYLNKKIVTEHDFVMPIKIRVTRFADNLQSNMRYDAKIRFTVERENAVTSTWYYEVPISIDISLGDGLDDPTCLGLDYKDGKLISTDSKQVHDVLEVTNGCLVNGKPVTLNNLEAKLEWKGNSLGSLVLGKDERETNLATAYYRSLAATFAPDMVETYTVNLVPKNGKITGKGEITVLLRASIMTANGLQFVENKIKYDVDVLRVHDCFSFELPNAETDLITTPRDKEQTFKMKNLCAEDLEIRTDLYPKDFISITPVNFNLKAGQEQTLKVKPKDSPVGVYLLEIRARTPGHTYEGVKVGLEAFRVFLEPLQTDCVVMDNYEYDLYDTVTIANNSNDINGMRYGYLINRCYTTSVQASYPLRVLSDADVGMAMLKGLLPGIASGAAGLAASYAADTEGTGFVRPAWKSPAEQAASSGSRKQNSRE